MDTSDNNIIPLPKMEVEQSSLPYADMLPVWTTWSFWRYILSSNIIIQSCGCVYSINGIIISLWTYVSCERKSQPSLVSKRELVPQSQPLL